MPGIGIIGFLSPWLLLGLLALPFLWWLLRAIPPAAIKRRFPAVTLLLGLKDPESMPEKTPWWLLLIRLLAVAALIVGFAGPVLNPKDTRVATRPVVILTDASWASAPDWALRKDKITTLLSEIGRQGRPVAVVSLTNLPAATEDLPLRNARDWAEEAPLIEPQPFEPDYVAAETWLSRQEGVEFDTIWISDGLAREGRPTFAEHLMARGALTVFENDNGVLALGPAAFENGVVQVPAIRAREGAEQTITITAFGPDPSGIERRLAKADAVFAEQETAVDVSFDLPSELRNRIRRFVVSGKRSAGAVALTDDTLQRRKVALFAGQRAREGQELVSALHFLKKALQPTTELIEAPVRDSLLADPDVVMLADVAKMTAIEAEDLLSWVEGGGLLVRFAGPQLAAMSLSQIDDDPLLPVRLRAGGRSVGGAMSWGSPKKLKLFSKDSPFFGLELPDEVEVTSQVIAQPDPNLTGRVIAELQDGTPLVTRKYQGDGQVVLIHVTANAEWSTLPLSGLFVQMLERLAVSTRAVVPAVEDLAGQLWQPEQVMNGFGELRGAEEMIAVKGETLALGEASQDLLPGAYRNGERQIAVNVINSDRTLAPALWSDGAVVEMMEVAEVQPLKALILAAALIVMMLDILATLWISGRLIGSREGVVVSMLALALLNVPELAEAQDAKALRATQKTVLAYVVTGDAQVDQASEAGLLGLSRILVQRTAIEPADPIAVDLEADELAFFPLIYWPISESQSVPSQRAYARLNTYLQTGGMILFDTRDANLGGSVSATPNGRRLQQFAAQLNIPALEPIPADHVLTRTFYLLQDFSGRHARADVWVEAAPTDAVRIEGMPFRNLNDGVSPVVIGGNDWASAWAVTRQGAFMFPVGRGGYAGDRQREIAFRFGVNLVMYVLTGNYKSDQVHVPALLERLGQ